jgi:glutamate-5-semialdehyde dehydrogenase
MLELQQQILDLGRQARHAARQLAGLDSELKDVVLGAMAQGIDGARAAIKAANDEDLAAARASGMSGAMLDRLKLDDDRINDMIGGLEDVAALSDPVGDFLSVFKHPNGMAISKVRVPIGVIGMIYESRPNVTADAAGLTFKSGNAVILRGGSEARGSNRAILDAMLNAAGPAGLPEHAIQMLPTTDREAVNELLRMDAYVDLIIPRGGEGLIRAVAEQSRVPVLKHYKGVCHVYVDKTADLNMASAIAVNAKCQRPGVCNAMETLLVHADIADNFLPPIAEALIEQGVELRGDQATRQLVPQCKPAKEDDWSEEYLDLILSVRVVPDLDAAIDHIERYGSHHSDVIVTTDEAAAERFTTQVDSATVYVNASSRFTDGGQFGMGAEIGISTDKLHARGPCGLEELTTYKYVIVGSGQVR